MVELRCFSLCCGYPTLFLFDWIMNIPFLLTFTGFSYLRLCATISLLFSYLHKKNMAFQRSPVQRSWVEPFSIYKSQKHNIPPLESKVLFYYYRLLLQSMLVLYIVIFTLFIWYLLLGIGICCHIWSFLTESPKIWVEDILNRGFVLGKYNSKILFTIIQYKYYTFFRRELHF